MRCGAIHISTVQLEKSTQFETLLHDGNYSELTVPGIPSIKRFSEEEEAVCWHNYVVKRAKAIVQA
jgi:hypothetical protein